MGNFEKQNKQLNWQSLSILSFQSSAGFHLFHEVSQHEIQLFVGRCEEVYRWKYHFDIAGMFGCLWQSNLGRNLYGINGHMVLLQYDLWNQKSKVQNKSDTFAFLF